MTMTVMINIHRNDTGRRLRMSCRGRRGSGQATIVCVGHPDPSYGPGVLPVIGPIGGGTHRMPFNFSNENNNEVTVLRWETNCDQNTAPILVLEAPNILKHNEFQ